MLLFGQSAGSINTFTISTLPQATSLISAAITESGGGRDTALNASVQALGMAYASSLNCGDSDVKFSLIYYDTAELTFSQIACLLSKSVTQLNNTDSGNISVPYVDGTVIPAQPSQAGVVVPTIFGSSESMRAPIEISSD